MDTLEVPKAVILNIEVMSSELQITSTASCAFLFIDLQPVFTDRFNDTEFKPQTERALAFARSAVSPEKIVHIRYSFASPDLT